jgi:hypothetical protein
MAAEEHLSGDQFVDLYHHTAPEIAEVNMELDERDRSA